MKERHALRKTVGPLSGGTRLEVLSSNLDGTLNVRLLHASHELRDTLAKKGSEYLDVFRVAPDLVVRLR